MRQDEIDTSWGYGIIKTDDGQPHGIVTFPNCEKDIHDLGNTECKCNPSYDYEPERGAYQLCHKKLIGQIY